MFDADEYENHEWVEDMVRRERRRGAEFSRTRNGIYRRSDALVRLYWEGLIGRTQMEAGRRYQQDYNDLHRSGRYRSTIYRFIEQHGAEEELEHTLGASLQLRGARAVLTPRQRVLCDAVCGEDLLIDDPDLNVALKKLFQHYGAETFGSAERTSSYRPTIKTEEEKRTERIQSALARVANPAPIAVPKPKGPSAKPVVDDEGPNLTWEDFLPQKPSRDDRSMDQKWLATEGVFRANRDSRRLGVQASAESKAKKRAKGRVRKRVRRKGNS